MINFAGCIFGIGFPIITMTCLSMFVWGRYSLTDETESPCFSVEYPNTQQYSSNPTEAEGMELEFAGLTVINVTSRMRWIFWVGYVLELFILILVL